GSSGPRLQSLDSPTQLSNMFRQKFVSRLINTVFRRLEGNSSTGLILLFLDQLLDVGIPNPSICCVVKVKGNLCSLIQRRSASQEIRELRFNRGLYGPAQRVPE